MIAPRPRDPRITRWLARTSAIAWLALIAYPTAAHAQLPALVEMSAEYSPATTTTDRNGDPAKFQMSSYQIALSLPIPLSARQFLIPGITYHADSIDLPQMASGSQHSTFHAPELSATFVQLLPKRWSVTVRGAASIAGNLDTVDRRMIAYNALALVGWSASDRVALGAGVLVAGGFGQVLPLPALSLRWKPRDDLRVDVFLPAFATVRYTMWDRIELGARTEVGGKTYAIRDPALLDRAVCPSGNGGGDMMTTNACLDHVRYTVASAGLLAGVRLTSTIWLTAFAGIGFYRRADKMDRDDDQLPGTTHSLPRAMFIRTNLAWRLPGS